MQCMQTACMIDVTMPKAVQIRDVPDDTVAVMRARAAAEGMSMSEYLRSELPERGPPLTPPQPLRPSEV